MLNGFCAVNSYDEWSALAEVAVGVAENYDAHDLDASFRLFHFENLRPLVAGRHDDRRVLDLPKRVLYELQEDLEGFVTALRQCGVLVRRPAEIASTEDIRTPYWSARPTPALNIRDQTVILGDTIVETAPHIRGRYFENDHLKPIFQHYFDRGASWISMPRPTLARGTLDAGYFTDQGF